MAILTGLIETRRELEQKRVVLQQECEKAQKNLEAQIAGYEM